MVAVARKVVVRSRSRLVKQVFFADESQQRGLAGIPP